MRQIYRTEGFKGFFKGYLPVCGMRLIGLPFYFVGYETSISILEKDNNNKKKKNL